MLNKVILMGRIVQELELKQTQSGVPVLSFTIAVDRSFVKQGEERQSDFIDCVAWRNQAEFISRWFGKGRMIALVGNLRKRVYEDKNGTKHYVTEVYVDEVSFTGEKASGGNGNNGYGNGGYGNNNYGNNGGYGGYNNNNNYGGYGQQNNGGYQQGGGYNGGYGSQQSAPQAPAPANNAPNAPQPDDAVNIGDFQDFEVFSDDGVPF